jgi:hypothetical protein
VAPGKPTVDQPYSKLDRWDFQIRGHHSIDAVGCRQDNDQLYILDNLAIPQQEMRWSR